MERAGQQTGVKGAPFTTGSRRVILLAQLISIEVLPSSFPGSSWLQVLREWGTHAPLTNEVRYSTELISEILGYIAQKTRRRAGNTAGKLAIESPFLGRNQGPRLQTVGGTKFLLPGT